MGGARAGRGAPLLQGRADGDQDAAGAPPCGLACPTGCAAAARARPRPGGAPAPALPPRWCSHPVALPPCAAPAPGLLFRPSQQKEDSDKPVSDQWLDPFVIVGEDNNPVGTVQDGEAAVKLQKSTEK